LSSKNSSEQLRDNPSEERCYRDQNHCLIASVGDLMPDITPKITQGYLRRTVSSPAQSATLARLTAADRQDCFRLRERAEELFQLVD
jgi:hypothetical protein